MADLININDLDECIIYLPKQYNYLIRDIERKGSISVYLESKYFEIEEHIKILEKYGFKMSLSKRIKFEINNNDTKENRIKQTLYYLSTTLRTRILKNKVKPEHINNICFDIFSLKKIHTKYEFYEWFEDLIFIGNIYIDNGLELICSFDQIKKEIEETMKNIIPKIKYTILDNNLIIKLDDIIKYIV